MGGEPGGPWGEAPGLGHGVQGGPPPGLQVHGVQGGFGGLPLV